MILLLTEALQSKKPALTHLRVPEQHDRVACAWRKLSRTAAWQAPQTRFVSGGRRRAELLKCSEHRKRCLTIGGRYRRLNVSAHHISHEIPHVALCARRARPWNLEKGRRNARPDVIYTTANGSSLFRVSSASAVLLCKGFFLARI